MAAGAAQLRFSPLDGNAGIRRLPTGLLRAPAGIRHHPHHLHFPMLSVVRSSNLNQSQALNLADLPSSPLADAGSGNYNYNGNDNNGKSGGGGRWNPDDDGAGEKRPSGDGSGTFDFLLSGWRSRVDADPQFPFKVLMEELIGVSANVLGDMASRPNFGLNELDFVFSTLVVGAIVNFVLMYLLAPTTASSAAASAAGALPSHIFQPGAYSILARLGTFVYKGTTFAAVGFAAGLAGTAISNGLITLRKRMDPTFNTPNEAPPTILNAATWALHMGFSSNLRYQTLNGIEFVAEKALPSAGFKASVVVLRCLNNLLGGMTFVALARLTGSQKSASANVEKEEIREKLVEGNETVMDCNEAEAPRSET